MEMSGERTIGAPRAQVWAALNDAEVLKACISGCESMEKTSDTSFTAVVVQKVGPVKARFTGEVELSDIVEGESYTISGKGKGGAAGGASGEARVTLTDTDSGTLLSYNAEAKVTGKIAQLGSRLINGFAKKMADQFFDKFQEQFEAPAEDAQDQTQDQAESDGGADAADAIREQVQELAHDVNEASKKVETAVSEVIDDAQEKIGEAVKDVRQAVEDSPVTKKSFWKRLFGG